MKEIWKPVPGYPIYEVSNLGRVRSLDREIFYVRDGKEYCRTMPGKILKQANVRGYRTVTMFKDTVQISKKVHRLVARVFIGKPPFSGALVRHQDDNPANNRASNLLWGSSLDNSRDMVERKRQHRGPQSKYGKGDAKLIRDIDAYIYAGFSTTEIVERFGVTKQFVTRLKYGRTWSDVSGTKKTSGDMRVNCVPPVVQGSKNGRAVLNENQVKSIFKRVTTGQALNLDVAEEYGVNPSVISAIRTGRLWSHITGKVHVSKTGSKTK